MKKSVAPKTVRKPRSDAQRNRERILEVARQVFTRRGADASMDEIARRAKIGPGTLYRGCGCVLALRQSDENPIVCLRLSRPRPSAGGYWNLGSALACSQATVSRTCPEGNQGRLSSSGDHFIPVSSETCQSRSRDLLGIYGS